MTAAKRLAVASLLLVLPAACDVVRVMADPTPACMPPQKAVPVPLEHVPPPLLRSLAERLGRIARPRESFNITDVAWSGTEPSRRFMFFWTTGGRWVIATEQGGFAYHNPIFLYELSEDERKADPIAEKDASSNSVCVVASDLIAMP